MEQIGQFTVDSTTTGAAPFASWSLTTDGVVEKLVGGAFFSLLSEDSVLDEDEDGVGEPRDCGIL
jgi:hypothetical protein